MRWSLAMLMLLTARISVAAEFVALTYHDIVPQRAGDAYSVTDAEFGRHMAFLKSEGYVPVSLTQLERVRRGEARLPERAVLLTFDDGLRSFAERALPVLERYGFPAVLSVVTSWADGRDVPREYHGKVMEWEELRRVARSPLVEVISHSDDLHHGLRVNSYGNEAPAGVARRFDPATRSFESEEQFRARIQDDLTRTQQKFAAKLGYRAKAIAWPFGEYDAVLQDEATRQGMAYQLSLDARPARTEELPRVRRAIASDYRSLDAFASVVSLRRYREARVRFVGVDLAPFAGRTAAEQDRLLSQMLRRLELVRANGVIVEAFSADGARAYFANDTVPVAADVLGRVLYAIRARTNAKQYLCVRVPRLHVTADDRRALFNALWRNRPVGGVIFDVVDIGADAHLMDDLRYYHPDVLVGAVGMNRRPGEFRVVTVADNAAGVENVGASHRATDWFLVRLKPDTTEKALRAQLRALREAGVRNFGYGSDDYAAGRPDVIVIVDEFSARSGAGEAR